MSWFILLLAGLLEVVWAVSLKFTEGFTRPGPTGLVCLAMVLSVGLLGLAMRQLPLGVAYAVWTGIGAVGAVAVSVLFLGEPVKPLGVLGLGLMLAGMACLKLSQG